MRQLVLVRGLPGAGKSTFAGVHFPHHVRCEADEFMVDHMAMYKYDPSKVADAHRACALKAENALKSGHSAVVCNTFTQEWEMDRYYSMADQLADHLLVFVIARKGENVHGVFASQVAEMAARWQHTRYDIIVSTF